MEELVKPEKVVEIEKKWQEEFEKAEIDRASEEGGGKKLYVLEMFPYPSGSTLHMGHAFNYVIGDIYARFKRMQGFNVLHPAGFDSFGLPAENAAIKEKAHPREFIERAIPNYLSFYKKFGFSYDYSRLLKTSDVDYYRWNQYLFLKMYERGLVYRKKASVNWCPDCKTVLANEQVHNGKCWRHTNTDVEVKQLEQWFVRTTAYAEELLKEVEKLDWPERIKAMQVNWIGRSEGASILFEIPWEPETNFVLLHGYTGSPDKNFFPWLKSELEKRGYKVSVPALPNPDAPNIEEQIKFVLETCEFNEHTIVLGHSLGATIALKVVEALDKPVKKLILAAGTIKPERVEEKPYGRTFSWEYDFEKIKKNVKFGIVYLRDLTDTIVDSKQFSFARDFFGAEVVEFEAKEEHLRGEKEPEVLKQCANFWEVFTTRADTLFGVTFMVVAAQHPRLQELVREEQKREVEQFLQKVRSTSEKDLESLEKEGAFTGSYALHPITGERIPVWTGNFVLPDYGSGMVMAVPAHDERDFEFAKKYKIPIKEVVKPKGEFDASKGAYTGAGVLINSGEFDGMESERAREEITRFLESKGLGKKAV
ncbi:hypothetical protein D6817_02415, partial [Candidatus Pacearchaeota archaeon]